MKGLEKFLKKNKNIIQFLGIITALFTLILTCVITCQTKKSIELSYKQYEEMAAPIWSISVINDSNNIDDETIKFTSNNPSVVLNSVNLFYSNEEKIDSLTILKTENWNTLRFKDEIINDLTKFYSGNQFLNSFNSCLPICLIFSYYQHGSAKIIKSFYKVNIRVYLENEKTKLSFKSFEFLRFFNSLTNSEIRDELEAFNYNYCYKSCCKERFLYKKKTEIVKNDKYLNELLDYSGKLNEYVFLTIIDKNDTSNKIKISYPEFIVKKSLFSEIKSNQEFILSKKRHFQKPVFQGFINLKNYLDTVVYPPKNDFNQIMWARWHSDRKKLLRKYNDALMDSLYKSIRIE